jgi:glycosyltransferase involved in cell wall biosynthesis
VPDLPAGAPLVSVVIATYNRRADIERCLEGLAAQTYPNLEVVIVNDGGEPIDDIVSRFPFATLVNLEQNLGGMKAGIAGMKLAHGEFAQWMADDDWLYPDHFTRLVSALITSGASIAHTNGLIRHQRRLPDGVLETSGFNAGVFIDSTTPSDALIATAIVLISMLFRRSVFDEIGPPIDIVIADYEIQVRASERYAFAYVDQTTVEWRLRGESYFAGMDSPAAMRYVFEVLYPRPQRPMIEQNRASTIANVASRPAGQPMFPPTVLVSYKPV